MVRSRNEQSRKKKKRTPRSLERMAEMVLEAERTGQAKVCHRERIAQAQLSRWKEMFLNGGNASLKQMKTGPKQKVDPQIMDLQKDKERLKEALLETNIELQLIRKKRN